MSTTPAGHSESLVPSRPWHRFPELPRSTTPELLDERGHDAEELSANLHDIRRVNRLAGGTRATLRALPPLLDRVPPDRPADVLDLATGSGDIPRAIIAQAIKAGRSIHVVASDLSPAILAEAEHALTRCDNVSFASYDARSVSLPDRSVDVVLCSLALHHFTSDDAVTVLREMTRLSRVGFILNDITRGRLGLLSAWAASRVATRNRLTRHDMPLSVRRAFTPDELRELLRRAELSDAVVRQHYLFRMTAVWHAPDVSR